MENSLVQTKFQINNLVDFETKGFIRKVIIWCRM